MELLLQHRRPGCSSFYVLYITLLSFLLLQFASSAPIAAPSSNTLSLRSALPTLDGQTLVPRAKTPKDKPLPKKKYPKITVDPTKLATVTEAIHARVQQRIQDGQYFVFYDSATGHEEADIAIDADKYTRSVFYTVDRAMAEDIKFNKKDTAAIRTAIRNVYAGQASKYGPPVPADNPEDQSWVIFGEPAKSAKKTKPVPGAFTTDIAKGSSFSEVEWPNLQKRIANKEAGGLSRMSFESDGLNRDTLRSTVKSSKLVMMRKLKGLYKTFKTAWSKNKKVMAEIKTADASTQTEGKAPGSVKPQTLDPGRTAPKANTPTDPNPGGKIMDRPRPVSRKGSQGPAGPQAPEAPKAPQAPTAPGDPGSIMDRPHPTKGKGKVGKDGGGPPPPVHVT